MNRLLSSLLLSFNTFRLLLLSTLLLGVGASADDSYWSGIAGKIVGHVDRAESLYADGDPKGARRAVIEAYFGVFEETKMEAAMRIELGAKHTYQVERLFGALRKAIKKGVGQVELAENATALREAIVRDALLLDSAGITPEVFRVNE